MPRNVWRHTLDVSGFFHDDSISIVDKAHRIGAMIRDAVWFVEGDDGLEEITEMFCDMEPGEDDAEFFDDWWTSFYDWCDEARIWVKTF
jgi:hypothetical protein